LGENVCNERHKNVFDCGKIRQAKCHKQCNRRKVEKSTEKEVVHRKKREEKCRGEQREADTDLFLAIMQLCIMFKLANNSRVCEIFEQNKNNNCRGLVSLHMQVFISVSAFRQQYLYQNQQLNVH